MICVRCEQAEAHKYDSEGLCGICSIIEAGKTGIKAMHGVQGAKLVPAHFNRGLGRHVEDYDDLKRKRKQHQREGAIDAWD